MLQTIDFCFESAFSKINGFNKITFLDRRGYKHEGVSPNLKDFSEKGGYYARWYKLNIEYSKIIDDSDIQVSLPPYIILENNFEGQPYAYTKKKSLKTKNHYTVQLVRIKICKTTLVKIADLLPPDFYLASPYIGGYKHSADTDVSAIEKLPFPVVLYPGRGAFIGFKKTEKDKAIYFCSCMRNAIRNCAEMYIMKKYDRDNYKISFPDLPVDINMKRLVLNNIYKELHDSIISKEYETVDAIMKHFNFHESLCHKCNEAVPDYYYRSPSTEFDRIYGWYVEQQYFEYGILSFCIFYGMIHTSLVLKDKCPEHIIRLFDFELLENLNNLAIENNYKNIGQLCSKESIERDKKLKKMGKKIQNEIENDVREKFGYTKIGEEWVQETSLFYKLKQEFSGYEVIHHGKPEWLSRQHFDIWIPEINVAIEYQGAQHFQAIEAFGGEEGLAKTQERDQRKKALCENNNVRLILVEEGYAIEDVIAQIKKTARILRPEPPKE